MPASGVLAEETYRLPPVTVTHNKVGNINAYGLNVMRTYGNAQPPYGFMRFCDTHPQECTSDAVGLGRFNLTPAGRADLEDINRLVNATIEPITDLELYGVTEHWTLPSDKGDCEDYALLKRKKLMERGWPASALLMTVVKDEKGDGHAVLTARTRQGDYILDNKTPKVLLWSKVPYEFMMRQSSLNPRAWVSLDPSHAPTTSISSPRQR